MRMLKAVTVVRVGLWDMSSRNCGVSGKLQICHLVEYLLESGAIEGESPVNEKCADFLDMFPSNTGHVEPRVNLGGPSPKAKYYLVTDSVPVP